MFFIPDSIRTRLAAAFGAMVLLLAAVGGAAGWWISQLNSATLELATDMHMQRALGDWLAITKTNVVRTMVLSRNDDPEMKRLLEPEMKQAAARIDALQREIEPAVTAARARGLWAEIATKRKAYIDARSELMRRQNAGDPFAGGLLASSVVPAANAYVTSIEALQQLLLGQVQARVQTAERTGADARHAIATLGAAGTLLALALGVWLAQSVTRPLQVALSAARAVADGDLTRAIKPRSSDEMGQLLIALRTMTLRLRELVTAVANEATSVAETSTQIAQANGELAHRTEEHASTLEETASAMEELAATVGHNAEHARQAAALAASATDSARAGGEIVDQVVASMDEISDAAKRITQIIGVIDGIAFQTNILALNAAVEAARAGDQGRGFAVVAGEVRNLAQRSAAASQEIRKLIGDSVRTVENGSRLVDAAGHKMVEVVLSAERVASLVAEIAQASQEQNAGIEQVNTAVTHLEQGIQQNASMVEEAGAATQSLEGKSQDLLRLVGRFRLDAHQAAAQPEAAEVKPIRVRQDSLERAHPLPASRLAASN